MPPLLLASTATLIDDFATYAISSIESLATPPLRWLHTCRHVAAMLHYTYATLLPYAIDAIAEASPLRHFRYHMPAYALSELLRHAATIAPPSAAYRFAITPVRH